MAVLAARVRELCAAAGDKAQWDEARFLGFLSPEEFTHASACARGACGSYGGYPNAERVFLGLSKNGPPDESEYPIVPLLAVWRDARTPGHRDFLGAVLALGLKRECVGDICVYTEKRCAVIYTAAHMAGFILDNLKSAGAVSIKLSRAQPDDIHAPTPPEERCVSVSSMRLDCVLAAMCGKSRSAAAEAITLGLVRLNSLVCKKTDRLVYPDDRISLKGLGKYKAGAPQGLSKKGKIRLCFFKYN